VGANSKDYGKELCGSFTNYGQESVDIFAPGVSVIGCLPNNYYKALDGTSFACPVASGVAALVWSRYPSLTALEIKEILLQSSYGLEKKKVKLPGEVKKKVRFGTLSATGGVVNAYKALELAAQKS
jgi:subtilisin family serine protease